MTSLIVKLQTRLNESNNVGALLASPPKDNNKSPASQKPKRRNRLKEKGFDKFSFFDELLGGTKNSNYKKFSKMRSSDTFKLVDSQFADTMLFQGNSPNELRLASERSVEKRRTLNLNSERELSPLKSEKRLEEIENKTNQGGDFRIFNYLTPTPQNQQDFGALQELDDEYEELDSKAEDIFVDQPGVYFEMNPQNKKIGELKQFYEGAELALNPNSGDTLRAKIERLKHNKFIKDYKYNEVPENITIGKKGILQPVFMQRTGSMCFTELWNNNERRKVARTVMNEITCLRIANPEREGELLYRPAKWKREAELKKQIRERKQKRNYAPIKSIQNDKARLREYAEPKYINSVSPVSNRGYGQVEVKQKDDYKTPEAASPVFTRSMSSPKFSRADSPISATKAMRESPTLFTKMMRAESRMNKRLSQRSLKPNEIGEQNLKELENLSSASKLAV